MEFHVATVGPTGNDFLRAILTPINYLRLPKNEYFFLKYIKIKSQTFWAFINNFPLGTLKHNLTKIFM